MRDSWWVIRVTANRNRLLPHVKPGWHMAVDLSGDYGPSLKAVQHVTQATLFKSKNEAAVGWDTRPWHEVDVVYVQYTEQ